jgi:hypothetical protein
VRSWVRKNGGGSARIISVKDDHVMQRIHLTCWLPLVAWMLGKILGNRRTKIDAFLGHQLGRSASYR